jgi:hypothetical protein
MAQPAVPMKTRAGAGAARCVVLGSAMHAG